MWNYNHWTGTTGRQARSTEPPENRFLLYFWIIREHFWSLMRLNLFVLLTSLPIVTIAPSIAAMNRVIFNMIEDKPQLLWQEYWNVFRKECKTAILTGIPIAAVVIFLFLLGGFFRDVMVPAWASLAALCGTAVVFVISNYVFAMLPYVEISILQCYKNAAILLLLCFWHNAINILIILFVTAIFVMGHPLTTPMLTGDFYTVGEILGHTLKGIGLSLGISTNFDAVTAQYVDVRMERKQTVLEAYHKAIFPKREQPVEQRQKKKAPEPER